MMPKRPVWPGVARGAPAGLLGMLVLVGAAESELSRRKLDIDPLLGPHYVFAGRTARQVAPRFSILLFGDSLTKCGLAPRLLEARTGRSAFNLAAIGAAAPIHFFQLRRALDAGARPSAVIVNFAPTTLGPDPTLYPRGLADVAEFRDCLELSWDSGKPGLIGQWVFARLFPSVRNRPQIGDRVRAALQGQNVSERANILAYRRNWWVNRGAQIFPKLSDSPRLPEFWDERAFCDPAWSPHPLNLIYLRKFLRTTAAHHIPTYLVMMPYHPRVELRRRELGLEAPYERAVLGEAGRFPNVVVLDARRIGLGPEVFLDSAHLDRDGVAALTVAVAAGLKRGAGPGTVPLAAAGVDPSASLIEDVRQSVIALHGLSTIRR